MAYQGSYIKEPEKVEQLEAVDPKLAEALAFYQNEVVVLQGKINEAQIYFDGLAAQVKDLDAQRTKILADLETAKSGIEKAKAQAQVIIDEATKLASEKVADILKAADEREKYTDEAARALHVKRKEIDAAYTELNIRYSDFAQQKEIFATKEKELAGLESALRDEQTQLGLDQAALATKVNDLSVRQANLDAREKELGDTASVLSSRLHVYEAESQALKLAQADFNIKLAALRDIDAEREKLVADQTLFAKNRDELMTREMALDELQNQLNNQRSNLDMREKLLVDKIKGVQP